MRPVRSYTQKFKILNEYHSITEASLSTGIDMTSIRKTANNERHTAGDLYWLFREDWNIGKAEFKKRVNTCCDISDSQRSQSKERTMRYERSYKGRMIIMYKRQSAVYKLNYTFNEFFISCIYGGYADIYMNWRNSDFNVMLAPHVITSDDLKDKREVHVSNVVTLDGRKTLNKVIHKVKSPNTGLVFNPPNFSSDTV